MMTVWTIENNEIIQRDLSFFASEVEARQALTERLQDMKTAYEAQLATAQAQLLTAKLSAVIPADPVEATNNG